MVSAPDELLKKKKKVIQASASQQGRSLVPITAIMFICVPILPFRRVPSWCSSIIQSNTDIQILKPYSIRCVYVYWATIQYIALHRQASTITAQLQCVQL